MNNTGLFGRVNLGFDEYDEKTPENPFTRSVKSIRIRPFSQSLITSETQLCQVPCIIKENCCHGRRRSGCHCDMKKSTQSLSSYKNICPTAEETTRNFPETDGNFKDYLHSTRYRPPRESKQAFNLQKEKPILKSELAISQDINENLYSTKFRLDNDVKDNEKNKFDFSYSENEGSFQNSSDIVENFYKLTPEKHVTFDVPFNSEKIRNKEASTTNPIIKEESDESSLPSTNRFINDSCKIQDEIFHLIQNLNDRIRRLEEKAAKDARRNKSLSRKMNQIDKQLSVVRSYFSTWNSSKATYTRLNSCYKIQNIDLRNSQPSGMDLPYHMLENQAPNGNLECQSSPNYLKSFKNFVKDQCQRFKTESVENISKKLFKFPEELRTRNTKVKAPKIAHEKQFEYAKENKTCATIDKSIQTIKESTLPNENVIVMKIDLQKVNDIIKEIICLLAELCPILEMEIQDLTNRVLNLNNK
ncbi:uncharacterized protein LOC111632084 [Centruroides sculpturatus]|uniref:uncharacterized protein LOC111632084 n=1 Tax=Centruroides sculpturatus TaxID=218467 RepID=UPI000C6ED469|nr:uncharacterized protein LOC111632084 [Centruroides sculpturatus]